MSNHTPAPWTVVPDGEDQYGPISVKAGFGTVCKLWLDDAPVPDFNARQRANARLIAAAPVLLEQLDNLLNSPGKSAEPRGGRMVETLFADVKVIKAAREAIEQATGEYRR